MDFATTARGRGDLARQMKSMKIVKKEKPHPNKVNTRHFNHETLSAKFGGPQVTLEIAKIYLEESPALVDGFRAAGETTADFEQLDSCAHKLKGSLGMLGAVALTSLAASLNKACREKNEQAAMFYYRELLYGLHCLGEEVEAYVSSR